MDLTLFVWALVLVSVLIDLWIINSVWRSSKSLAVKLGWSLLVVALPLLGWALWGVSGPRGVARAPSSPEHSKG
jgi:hypothetical protein